MKFAVSSDAETVMKGLDSRPEGHYNEEVTTSRIKFGDNVVTNHNKHVVLKRLYHAFVNVFIIALTAIDILWPVCAIIGGEEIDYTYLIILTTLIFVSGAMTFIQETRSSNAAAKLVSMVTTIITLRREDVEIEVDSADLVVGDIIILDAGDMIPADVRIIKSNHLKVDQSALTGESGGVTKTDEPLADFDSLLGCSNLAFMGSNVISGSAEAIVVAVGDDTIFGSMTEKITRDKAKTTYDKGSKQITKVLVKLMVYMVPPVIIIMIAKGLMNGEDLVDVFKTAALFAVTLAIGLMPEMLATIVSTNLAKGSIDMSKKKVIVKDVTSIQNLGAMDVLCSDKTGTLTENRISVKDCNDIHGNSSHMVEVFTALNSRNLKSSTNQIDWAIDEYAEECGFVEELEQYPYVADVPFDFFRRRATVVVKQDEDINLVITKGATPEILSISTGYLDGERNIQVLNNKVKNDIMGLVEWYSEKGMRVLGIAYKYVPNGKVVTVEDECDLIFIGFVVFTDPVKESAKTAVIDLRDYGIKTKVLTGDNEFVTRYIADQIGISTEKMMVGPQIDGMTDDELKEHVEETDVFVRLTPDNKSRVVKALRENGHTVGLIGDGINDIIAMKDADVSISVDTGTDIAKDTASMILLEKDLGILRDGVIEGRKVYVNTIKYVKMIGSINFGYMFSLILGSLLFNFEPMGALMILIFNLINDFACIFICWDKVEDEFVREPRKWDAPNLTSVMYRYGPMCVVTDIMSWVFFIFVVLPMVSVTVDGGMLSELIDFTGGNTYGITEGVTTASALVLSGAPLSDVEGFLPVAVLFQSLWCIEQYWMQVWAIHIVRTNKLPFFQAWSSKILVATTIIALAVGTILPFTGPLWEAISGCDALIGVPIWALIWMPFIACVYFFGAHAIKKHMLKTRGYFAC
ncbi:MAG: magnesium-translocating P-type ATPase [Methanomassiliicoccales archaeon]|nr:magnesium-translocating P-type ATPase [Methanomassiliicoccales archaeon]